MLASLSGWAAIRRQSGRSGTHAGPLADQHAVAGRLDLETPRRANSVRRQDIPHPAALIVDLDDFALCLPSAHGVVLVAAAETRTDADAVRTVEPFDGLQFCASTGRAGRCR